MKGVSKYLILILIPVGGIILYLLSNSMNKPIRTLGYYGPKGILNPKNHFIPDFEFINQFNEKFAQKDVEGKIYVCEYFFTTCKTICPIMNLNLEKVYKTFSRRNDFLILSHTVNPEEDSSRILLRYAEQHNAVDKNWIFLTGDKKQLYNLARKGYLLNAEAGKGDADDFIHTQNFALIDKEKHIRGFYDGTDSLEIERLITEIKVLMDEYEFKKNNN